MFRLIISESNSAFDDNPAGEVARILRELADKVEREGVPQESKGEQVTLRDVNGNRVGFARSEAE